MNDWTTAQLDAPLRVPSRTGRPRNRTVAMLAAEYLLHPTPRPHGLIKQLALCNNVGISNLMRTISELRNAAQL